MAPSSLEHRRTHNLLLVSKLLNQRDASSPFTLILDNLEQSGKPLLLEHMKRAASLKIKIIFVAFETLRRPRHVDLFVEAWRCSTEAWQKEVTDHIRGNQSQKTLLIIDCINPLASAPNANLPGLLSSFIGPTVSLLAIYHSDVPILSGQDVYGPSVLTLLRYLATTIFTMHSMHHILEAKAARDRSHAEPQFGLESGTEGVLQSLGANDTIGLVLEMEHRRKSGRGVKEWYYLPTPTTTSRGQPPLSKSREIAILLEDHPEFRTSGGAVAAQNEGEAETTFDLNLTDKQRRDREGVVLPYFDAQKGVGEGGRILYDMGEEDDFDEEEDEI